LNDRKNQILKIIKHIPEYYRRPSKKEYSRSVYERFRDCQRLGIMTICKNGHELFKPFKCNQVFCPICEKDRLRKIRGRLHNILLNSYPSRFMGQELIFLTLTLQVHKDRPIKTEVERIRKNLKKFWRKTWGSQSRINENKNYQMISHVRITAGLPFLKANQVNGGYFHIEVGNGQNVHVHGIILGYPIDRELLVDLWKKLTGDSWYVDIRKAYFKDKKKNWKKTFINDQNYTEKLKNVVMESVKYCIKGLNTLPVDELIDYSYAIMKSRSIISYGLFYDFPLDEETEDYACPVCGSTHFEFLQVIPFVKMHLYPDLILVSEPDPWGF